VTWSELEAANAPVYRETYTILSDQDLTHPFDTQGRTSACLCPLLAASRLTGTLGHLW
jgi:hypothetical protein